ncbi:MAG: hypothetical protein JWN34_2285, partial [Bryobacterales bacterium]|nr:hypothetical protein [Bryobacterales bacterium]
KECLVSTPDGMRDLLTVRFPLFDDAGEPYRPGMVINDITVRRQTERRLFKNAADLENEARRRACLAEISYQGLTHIGRHRLLQKAAALLGSTFAEFCRVHEIGPSGDLHLIAVYRVAPESAARPSRVLPVSAAMYASSIRGIVVFEQSG